MLVRILRAVPAVFASLQTAHMNIHTHTNKPAHVRVLLMNSAESILMIALLPFYSLLQFTHNFK